MLFRLEDVLGRIERALTAGLAAAAPKPITRTETIAWLALVWGASLIVGTAALQATVAFTLALGGSVSWWHFPLFPIFVIGVCYLACRRRWRPLAPRRLPLVAAPALAFIAFAFAFASTTLDMSPDGQTAHQEAIVHLANGWNPLHDSEWSNAAVETPDDYALRDVAMNMAGEYVVRLGAKGTYYQNATGLALFGVLNVGKGFNFILVAGASLLVLAAALYAGVRPLWAFAAAALAGLNPVAINQLLSTYVDGELGMALTALTASAAILAIRPSATAAAAFAAAIVLGINAKITGFFYAGFLGLAAIAFLRFQTGSYRGVTAFVIGSAIGVLLVGYSPIVHNVVTEGRLLGYLDDVPIWTNSFTTEHDRVTKLLVSLFSETHANPERPHLKIPFGITKFEWSDISNVAAVDARIGGFGPWMSGALVLSAAALLIAAAQKAPGRGAVAFGALVLILSVLPNREAWWARFVPQLWLLPVLIGAYGSRFRPFSDIGILGRTILVVALLNAGFVAAKTLWMQYTYQRATSYVLEVAAGLPAPLNVYFENFRSNRVVLNERGVAFVEQSQPCTTFFRPVYLVANFCLDGRSDPETVAALEKIYALEGVLFRRGVPYQLVVR